MVCVNVPFVLIDSFLFALLRAQNPNSNPSDYPTTGYPINMAFENPMIVGHWTL